MSAAIDTPALEIRSMTKEDIDRVIEIEISGYDFPWTTAIFADCLTVGYHCSVLVESGCVVGYAIFSTAVGEAHLLNLCIDDRQQGQGLGGYLLSHVLSVACSEGCRDVFLEVRPTNEKAVRLYQRFGFRTIGTRPSYYRALSGREDALVLTMTLSDDMTSSIFVPLCVKSAAVRH